MLHELLTTMLHQNQFASGGILLMVLGGIVASLRKVPTAIWGFAVRQTTLSFTVTDESTAFKWFKYWFSVQDAAKKIRRVDIYTPYNADGTYTTMLNPAPGTHWIWRGKSPVRIYFSRTDEKKVGFSTRAESFTVQMLGRDNKKLLDLMAEMYTNYLAAVKKTPSLYVFHSDWEEISGYLPRALDTVILPSSIKDKVVHDLGKFMESKEWYKVRGIPWRRCYLFHGIPGSGKTSLVNGLAAHFNMSTHVINLSAQTDGSLAKAVQNVGAKAIIVLEDIDCAKATGARTEVPEQEQGYTIGKDGSGKGYIVKISGAPAPREAVPETSKDDGSLLKGVTLSGLLNVLDGITTPSGAMFFMTTNHIAKLDPALLRTGRCDVKIYFGEIQEEQKLEMYKRFLGGDVAEARAFIAANPAVSASDFQELLLQHPEAQLTYSASTGE